MEDGRRLVDEGIGVVWSTAYLDEAENCAEVIVLNEGRALYQGDPKRMTSQVAGRVFQLAAPAPSGATCWRGRLTSPRWSTA